LIVAHQGVKPAVVMKAAPRTIALMSVATVIVAVFSSCEERFTRQHQVHLQFGNDKTEYVEVDKGKLDTALAHLKDNGGTCNIAYLDDDGRTLHDPYGRCSDPELKTDKVTMSATAKDRAAGDPNITYHVSGNSKDVSEVLNSFK
jgi:hypothetical protein